MKEFNLGDKVIVKETKKKGVVVGINKNVYAIRTEENPINELRDILTDSGKHTWYRGNELKRVKKWKYVRFI